MSRSLGKINLGKINIYSSRQAGGSDWVVYVPPFKPEHWDGEYLHGPAGDSFWRTFDEAVDFVRLVLEEA